MVISFVRLGWDHDLLVIGWIIFFMPWINCEASTRQSKAMPMGTIIFMGYKGSSQLDWLVSPMLQE